MTLLVVVESPNKVKKVAHYLGDGFKVVATVGHFRDLPKDDLAVDLESMRPTYVVDPAKKDVVQRLKASAAAATEVLIATDPDREGEAIGWHVAQVLGLRQAKRIEFHEITQAALRKAVAAPRPIDGHLVDAQQARRVLDRIVGYKVSPMLQELGKGLSAGRVQTATLHLVAQRERDRLAFKPEPYWIVRVNYAGGLWAELSDEKGKIVRPKTQEEAQAAAKAAEASPHVVRSVDRSEGLRKPPAPFTTSSLQQAASSRLGFDPKRTMELAQNLFEGGHISYHRSDSVNLSGDAQAMARDWIQAHQPESLPAEPPSYRSKEGSQEAHEAIRPTSLEPVELTGDERALYDLVRNRFLASQMKPAEVATTMVVLSPKGSSEGGAGIPTPVFVAARGQEVLAPHWMALERPEEPEEGSEKAEGGDGQEAQALQKLPALAQGQELQVDSVREEKKATKPPARFTEAGLVREMERLGIGRPSTYAATIDTLYRRAYVQKEKKAVSPTPLGLQVDDLMLVGLEKLTSHEYTSWMEEQLDQIAAGKQGWQTWLKAWWSTDFRPHLAKAGQVWGEQIAGLRAKAAAGDAAAARAVGLDPDAPSCPECGKPMRKMKGKSGPFWGCTGYPECRKTLPVAAQAPVKKGGKTSEINCLKCGKPMVERSGKSGKFLGCSGYPECRETAPIELTKARSKKCPKCGKVLTKRQGPNGVFWGCSGYPECKYTEQ
jgi:DNA topoisomerase-1